MNNSVVALVLVFFVAGIAAGIIAVVTMSALRADRSGDLGGLGDPLEYEPPGLLQGPGPPDQEGMIMSVISR
jgi:hypothetical protein